MIFNKKENIHILSVLDEIEQYLKNEINTIDINNLINKKFNTKVKEKLASICKMINKRNDEELLIYGELMLVCEKIANGNFEDKIYHLNTSNFKLNYIAKTVNNLTYTLKTSSKQILNILNSYSNHNYIDTIDEQHLNGSFNDLGKGINILGDSITKMLIEDKSNGLTLKNNSNDLLNNVDKLNQNTNHAAVKLEETAAAIEEITSILKNNMETIHTLSSLSNTVRESVEKGHENSQQTTKAMSNIDKEVSTINDTISIVDQIAFQTNILSLNAAVEAATAGEAGKGFAVVADEVRNLANRSAQAANEIKDIVQSATIKADEGKLISSKMIEGYSELHDNIEKTLTHIEVINDAFKEQQVAIEQINDAINSLDQETQQNAVIASQTHHIAEKTDTMANFVVSSADKKNFRGKDLKRRDLLSI